MLRATKGIHHNITLRLDEELYADAAAIAIQSVGENDSLLPEPFKTVGYGYGKLGEWVRYVAYSGSVSGCLDAEVQYDTTGRDMEITLYSATDEEAETYVARLTAAVACVSEYITNF